MQKAAVQAAVRARLGWAIRLQSQRLQWSGWPGRHVFSPCDDALFCSGVSSFFSGSVVRRLWSFYCSARNIESKHSLQAAAVRVYLGPISSFFYIFSSIVACSLAAYADTCQQPRSTKCNLVSWRDSHEDLARSLRSMQLCEPRWLDFLFFDAYDHMQILPPRSNASLPPMVLFTYRMCTFFCFRAFSVPCVCFLPRTSCVKL